ncbi:MAG: glycosyltransferase family 9 protein [Nitrospirae bacterium]|nr:glycosyltransferase family 9 protein [Nitrospirota bacterium]
MKPLYNNIKISIIKLLVRFLNALGTKKKHPRVKSERFLIITTTGIGDTLWGTPAIKALKETYPECQIGVLTNPSGLELLKHNPNIDEIFIFKRGFNGILSLPSLLKTLRHKKFETAFIFHASDRIIWLLAFFTGTSRIIGESGKSKGLDFILSDSVVLPEHLHGVEARLSLIKEVHSSTKQKTIEMFLTEGDREWVKQLLKNKHIAKGSFVIGLHPGAQKPYKCWPTENFISLGNALTERYKCSILITGDQDEKELADMLSSRIKNSINLAGDLNIRQTAALIEKFNIFITNDTGPMHIAFALTTPTVALFSPTNPDVCGPYNAKGTTKVISKPIICNPCIGKRCVEPKCMEQITVEEVLYEAENLISNLNKEKHDNSIKLQA